MLNGTTVPGLARTVSAKLKADGFQVGNINNASNGQFAESVVLFRPGKNRDARLVQKKLGINQLEPVDAQNASQAGNATVVVVVGQDQAH